jgi:hypothetical protein
MPVKSCHKSPASLPSIKKLSLDAFVGMANETWTKWDKEFGQALFDLTPSTKPRTLAAASAGFEKASTPKSNSSFTTSRIAAAENPKPSTKPPAKRAGSQKETS